MKSELKIGDIVLDMRGSYWGNTRFKIEQIRKIGNLTLLWARQLNKPIMLTKYHCNLLASEACIVDSSVRPMQSVPNRVLLRMMKKGIAEARREFTMRVNSKNLKRK